MKRFGKITTITSVFLTFAVIVAIMWAGQVKEVKAAYPTTWPARTVGVPYTGDSNVYCVLIDRFSLDIVDPNTTNNPTGKPESDTTWTEGAIAASQHAQSNGYKFTLPALHKDVQYAIGIFSNDTPAKTDLPILGAWSLLDPETGHLYTDTDPAADGRVRTIEAPYE